MYSSASVCRCSAPLQHLRWLAVTIIAPPQPVSIKTGYWRYTSGNVSVMGQRLATMRSQSSLATCHVPASKGIHSLSRSCTMSAEKSSTSLMASTSGCTACNMREKAPWAEASSILRFMFQKATRTSVPSGRLNGVANCMAISWDSSTASEAVTCWPEEEHWTDQRNGVCVLAKPLTWRSIDTSCSAAP